MSVLSRSALESSPLADLHAIASELGIDGFRRLRKDDLIERIVAHQGGDDGDGETLTEEIVDEAAAEPQARPRRRRGGRGRARADADAVAGPEAEEADEGDEVDEVEADLEGDLVKVEDEVEAEAEEEERQMRRGRERAGRAPRDGDRGDRGDRGERIVEGVVELLANGSGFVRVSPPEPSDDDVYISAAQVRRCELVSGDRVTGPAREPR